MFLNKMHMKISAFTLDQNYLNVLAYVKLENIKY